MKRAVRKIEKLESFRFKIVKFRNPKDDLLSQTVYFSDEDRVIFAKRPYTFSSMTEYFQLGPYTLGKTHSSYSMLIFPSSIETSQVQMNFYNFDITFPTKFFPTLILPTSRSFQLHVCLWECSGENKVSVFYFCSIGSELCCVIIGIAHYYLNSSGNVYRPDNLASLIQLRSENLTCSKDYNNSRDFHWTKLCVRKMFKKETIKRFSN